MIRLSIREQPAIGESIYCEVKLASGNGLISYGHMYFVCDTNKRIHQYPQWLKTEYYHTIIRRGYSWK
jgi:hypothetical protein